MLSESVIVGYSQITKGQRIIAEYSGGRQRVITEYCGGGEGYC